MAHESHSSDNDKPTSGVTIGNIIGGIRSSIVAGRDVIFPSSAEQQRAQRNRQAMLELVRNTWVKGVLEQSLHGAAMIELGLEERADAVERPWDMILQTPTRPNRPLPPGTKIMDIFDEMNRALLILGEPGSGKTTMLLDLARDTIAHAEGDPTQPMPVVFNLSSWAEKQQSITEWLVDELNTKYNIPKRIARPWVENEDLLLLLDGLDEVKREHRDACVKAINDFRQEHGLTPLVVCSRIADYEALTTRLKLQGAVLLQPLTPQQVDRYLEGAGTELLAVRKTLQHDPTLQELAQMPLMLSIMTLAYQGMSVKDLEPLDTIEARRRHVLDAYVQRMFERQCADRPYSPQQTVHWLTWLAQKMSQQAQSMFLIERIQPSWLQIGSEQRLYASIVGVIGLMVGVLNGGIYGLVSGFFVGLGVAMVMQLIQVGSIELVQIIQASMLILGLIFALMGGVRVWTTYRGKNGIRPVELLKWSWRSVEDGMVEAINSGRFNVKEIAAFGLLKGIESEEVKTKVTPNQGIKLSARNAVTLGGCVALPFIPVCTFLLFVVSKLSVPESSNEAVDLLVWMGVIGLLSLIVLGVDLGLEIGGGLAVIQHFILRFILYRSGYMPWNYARFLDHAAERIFLRKVGGGYIFVHRLLMEHFAAMNTEEAT